MTTKPIVVGTDGSPESSQAVEWAAREAHLRGAGLRIVSTAELLPRMTAAPQVVGIETVSSVIRRNRDRALTNAAKTAAQISPGVLIDTDALDGAPAQAVTDAGEGALMLVVGSRGGGAFAAMALGSVSRYAATHAHCPVVVVREEGTAARPQVVVGIRDPHDCAAALGFAVEEAALRNASLIVVHTWQAPGYDEDSVQPPTAVRPCGPGGTRQAPHRTGRPRSPQPRARSGGHRPVRLTLSCRSGCGG
jgi:nucleotide-binding universal stress UspA family protein